MRDLTKAQYQRKLEKYGFKPSGFMGYYSLPAPYDSLNVCSLNAGDRLRDRLAYLLTEWEKEQQRKPLD